MWIHYVSDLRIGDTIIPRFGKGYGPIRYVETLGEGRYRLHHTSGDTSRIADDSFPVFIARDAA